MPTLPESPMAPVFPGWNVWGVWQVKDPASFDPFMIGVSRDRQLRIWVEDHVRLGAPGANVDDPIALKGDQVQILPAAPNLPELKRKEEIPGETALLLPTGSDPQLRYVRFYNRGAEAQLLWPHDDDYLLDAIFKPLAENPITQGPAPPRIMESSGLTDIGEKTTGLLVGGIVLMLAFGFAMRSTSK